MSQNLTDEEAGAAPGPGVLTLNQHATPWALKEQLVWRPQHRCHQLAEPPGDAALQFNKPPRGF